MWNYVLAWTLMVIIAIGNAAIREGLLAKRLSELQAHQASTATAVVLFGLYIWGVVRLWMPHSPGHALAIGVMWLCMTLAFEFLFGHFVMGHPWSRLFHDYNLLAGRVWVIIPLWVTLAPYVFYRLRK